MAKAKSKATILVVEDESIVAEDIKTSLEKMGYAVPAVVSTGAEAIQKASELNPDLVLMDIMLKDKMSGITAAGQIRSLFNIPVIYLTAYVDDDTLERAKLTEPFGYITKPFDDRELKGTIEIALYKSSIDRKSKESREWFLVTLRSIGDAVIATDTEGKVIFMNPVAMELTGWSEGEAIGMDVEEVFNIVNEATGEKLACPARKVLTHGKIEGRANHTILISRNGKKIHIDDSGAPIRDEDGGIAGVVMVFRDITERMNARKVLAESEARYNDLFDNAHDMIQSVGPDGKFIFVNRAWLNTMGYTETELEGLSLFDVLHPDSKAHCMELFRKVISGEIVDNVEAVFITKVGQGIPVEGNVMCRFKDGAVAATQGIFRNITERKKIAASLEKAAHEWRNTFDSISDFVSVFDTESRFVRVNRALAAYLGVEPGDLIGKHCHEVFKTPASSDAGCLIQKASEAKMPITAEKHYENIDLPLLVTVSPIIDEKGKTTGSVHIAKDITELKQTEERLKEESNISSSLLNIFETLNLSLNEKQLISNVMNIVPRYLKCNRVSILLYDKELCGFMAAGFYGFGPDEERRLSSLTLKEGDFPAIDAVLKGKQIIVNDARDYKQLSRDFVDLFGIESAALMPIVAGGKVQGMIIGGYRNIKPMKTKDEALLKGLVDGLGIALHNSRLYKESIARLIELTNKVETIKAMGQIDKEILSTLDKATVLDTSISMIRRVIPCDRTSILLKEKKSYRIIAEWGMGALKNRSFTLTDSQAEIIETNHSPIFLSDLTKKENTPYFKAKAEIGMRSILMLPLVSKGKVIGLLDIGSKYSACFLPTHLSIAEDIASQIAVALEHANLYEDLQMLFLNSITSLASVIDAKSPWTKGHSERVTNYAVAIAREMGLSPDILDAVELGGILHDIGKIGTYDKILDKPAELHLDEMEEVRLHPVKGASILKPIKQLEKIVPLIRHHHERIDGKGYPDGLKGDDIPLLARVLCVADAYDSMVSDRPYRKAPGKEYAISELKRCAGTQFDFGVVEAFLRVIEQQNLTPS
ncbi:MAG: PAS domain S-box protein [Nitrospirae bacterium]|nr:PAS domain S-box protein [Nitrospirota bacterium]